MTIEEAIAIRERAVRLGLRRCCDQCREDIETLEGLSGSTNRGGFTIVPPSLNTVQERKPSVLGTRTEDAARRLRRSIGRGSAA